MERQGHISLEKNEALVGTTQKVLIDRFEGDTYFGRTEGDSPEVDNEVVIQSDSNYLRVGDFVQVKITGADHYDLTGEVVSGE